MFRARQILSWVYRDLVFDYAAMTNLPAALRARLAVELPVMPVTPEDEVASDRGLTRKGLLGLRDDNAIEAVLMVYPGQANQTVNSVHGRDRGDDSDDSELSDERRDGGGERTRRTACVSSQVGCAVGCPFCATGMSGLLRNLTPGEIVGQVLHFARRARDTEGPEARLTNIVFMGQGEPLANLDRVWQAVEALNSAEGFGLGARHMTISTSGLAPKIRELANRSLQVGLAISLHAPDDELRNRLVPVNRRYPIAELLSACRDYVAKTNRRVSFEYAMMDGINDSLEQASKLSDLLAGFLGHVNLIPLNPVEGSPFQPTPWPRLLAFQSTLRLRGIPCTIRTERGDPIDAACGQLRARRLGLSIAGAARAASSPAEVSEPAPAESGHVG